jgi:hypothetical protein
MHAMLAVTDSIRSWTASVRCAAGLAALVEGTLTGLCLVSRPHWFLTQVPHLRTPNSSG